MFLTVQLLALLASVYVQCILSCFVKGYLPPREFHFQNILQELLRPIKPRFPWLVIAVIPNPELQDGLSAGNPTMLFVMAETWLRKLLSKVQLRLEITINGQIRLFSFISVVARKSNLNGRLLLYNCLYHGDASKAIADWVCFYRFQFW